MSITDLVETDVGDVGEVDTGAGADVKGRVIGDHLGQGV